MADEKKVTPVVPEQKPVTPGKPADKPVNPNKPTEPVEVPSSNPDAPPIVITPETPIFNNTTGETNTGPAPKDMEAAPAEPDVQTVKVTAPEPVKTVEPNPEDPWDATNPGDASEERQNKMVHGVNNTGEPKRDDSSPELLVSGMPDDPLRQNTPLDRLIHGDPQ